MPSELSPGWSNARMTKSQIRKVLKEQEEARKLAEKKLSEAMKSDEWKKEQEKLAALEKLLDNDDLIV